MKNNTRDTGIYQDVFFPPIPGDAYQEIERDSQEKETQLFGFDSLLTKAELYAQAIIDRYKGPPPNEEWAQYPQDLKEKKGKSTRPWPKSSPGGLGRPRAPSKTEGIPDNVERQVEYAQLLLSYVQCVRQALDRQDMQEAVLYGYWVGRFYEAL